MDKNGGGGGGRQEEIKQGNTAPRKILEEYKVNEFIRCKNLKAIRYLLKIIVMS